MLKTALCCAGIFSACLAKIPSVMKNPAASNEVSQELYNNFPKSCHPECSYRGSTMLTTTLSYVEWVGAPVRGSPGFPLKTCGNDGP